MKLYSVKLYIRYVILYSGVVGIILLCLSPLFFILKEQMQDRQISQIEWELNEVSQTLATEFQNVYKAVNSLSMKSSFQRLNMSTTTRELFRYEDPVEISKELTKINYDFDMVGMIFMYFDKSNMIIDSQKLYNSTQQFYDNRIFYPQISYEVWDMMLNEKPDKFWPTKTVKMHNGLYSNEFLTYIHEMQGDSGSVKTVILIRNDYLERLLKIIDKNANNFYYITDAHGQILHGYNYMGEEPLDISEERELFSLDQEEYIVISSRVSNTELKMVTGINSRLFIPELRQINRVLSVYLLIIFGLINLLALFLVFFRAYKLKRIKERIKETDLDGPEAENLDKYLENTIQNMQIKHIEVRKQFEKITQQLDHKLVESFLYSSDQEVEKVKNIFRISAQNYMVILKTDGIQLKDSIQGKTLQDHIKNIYGANIFLHTTDKKLIIIMIRFNNISYQNTAKIKTNTLKLIEVLNKKCYVLFTDAFYEISEMSELFLSAEHNILTGFVAEGEVASLKDLEAKPLKSINMQEITKLYEMLMLANIDHAIELMDQMYIKYQDSMQNFCQLYYNIRGLILSVGQKIGYVFPKDIPEYNVDYFYKFQFDILKEYAMDVCNQINQMKNSHNIELQEKIMEFIEENYMNSNLNVAMISDEFNISKKYLSSFFKEQTNVTYTEFLEKIRLNHAMTFLKETDLSITEIALKSGFSTSNTFYKVFKRRFEISPTAMRKKVREE